MFVAGEEMGNGDFYGQKGAVFATHDVDAARADMVFLDSPGIVEPFTGGEADSFRGIGHYEVYGEVVEVCFQRACACGAFMGEVGLANGATL